MAFYQSYKTAKVTGNGVVTFPNVTDSRHLIIAVDADASTSGTFKFVGSVQKAVPNFAGAATSSNQWAYMAFRNLGTGSLTAGATGVTITTTTHHQLYEIESNGLEHVGIEFSGMSGDGFVVQVLARNAE